MNFSQASAVRWIRYVAPFKNPYMQAQYLLYDFELAGQYVLIAAWENPAAAARLHHSIDAFVKREYRNLRSPAWIPAGIMTITNSHLCMKENYLRSCERGSRVNICHVYPESNPDRQAVQLLNSGLVSNRYIVVRGVEMSKRNQFLARKLIEKLDETTATGFLGPKRIVCPPPKGLLIYTARHLRCEFLYDHWSSDTHTEN